ncbi:hypothetical protein NMG60_11004905 [Bertholletia excelsa]
MFMVGSLLRLGSVLAWIVHIVACMGGCLGSHHKSKLITSTNEPPNLLTFTAQKVSKTSSSKDFWTTSACEMDNSLVQSQGSISSISTSNLMLDSRGTSCGNVSSEFVNHGFLLWSKIRQQWVGTKKPEDRECQPCEPKLSWNTSYDSLLGTNKPFPQPISLSEMVDFLVDVWEQEGMYD